MDITGLPRQSMLEKMQNGMNEKQAIFSVAMEMPLSYIPTLRLVKLLQYALELERVRGLNLPRGSKSFSNTSCTKIVQFPQPDPSEEGPATTLIL